MSEGKALRHHFHDFKVEWFEDENGPSIRLEQADGWGRDDDHIIVIHPRQLRAVCEEIGIQTSDQQADKTIATLQRRMQVLRAWILDLEAFMGKHSHQNADLRYEVAQLGALAELADEWCSDFDVQADSVAIEISTTSMEVSERKQKGSSQQPVASGGDVAVPVKAGKKQAQGHESVG